MLIHYLPAAAIRAHREGFTIKVYPKGIHVWKSHPLHPTWVCGKMLDYDAIEAAKTNIILAAMDRIEMQIQKETPHDNVGGDA